MFCFIYLYICHVLDSLLCAVKHTDTRTTCGRCFKRLTFTHVGSPRFGEKSANSLAVKAQNRFSVCMFQQMFFQIGFKLFRVNRLDLGLNPIGEHADCFAQQFQRTDLIALGFHGVCVVEKMTHHV